MAQGRSTKITSMIKWIRTSRLPIKNSLCEQGGALTFGKESKVGFLQRKHEEDDSLATYDPLKVQITKLASFAELPKEKLQFPMPASI